MNIIVNKDRTVEKEYTEKDGSQNENRITELNFTLPEEYSDFVTKIAFITEDGNFSDYIEDGTYILKNNITKYREVLCFVWLTDSVNNKDFRSQAFPLEFYYNEDPSDYIPSEQEKSQIELLFEELDEKIQEVTELEENVYTKDETYSKEEVDEIIPTDISDLNNDSGFIDKTVNDLTNYYKKTETYTKQEVDSKVSSVYKYKGTVATYQNLPSTDLTVGDVYNVETADSEHGIKAGDNVAWNGTAWDILAGTVDLSGYQTKIDSSHKLSADLVDDTNSTHKFTNATEKSGWNAKYNKPSGGIPKTDLDSSVQASLDLADSALQAHQDISGKEDKSNKKSELNSNLTNDDYLGAKVVYDALEDKQSQIDSLQAENEQLWNDHPDILDNNDLPSGTDLTLNGTGDLKMKVDVGGNSTQATVAYVNVGQWEQGSIDATNGLKLDTDTVVRTKDYINVVPNILYNLSRNISTDYMNFRFYDSNYNYLGTQTTEGMATTNRTNNRMNANESSMEITINNTSVAYMKMIDTSNDLSTIYTVSTEATPSPNYKQAINNVEGDVKVKAKNKNIFDENSVSFINGILDDNGQPTSGSSHYTENFYNVKPNISYDLSGTLNTSSTSYRIYFYDINKNWISRSDQKTGNLAITMPANCYYIRIQVSTAITLKTNDIMLRESSTNSSYIPHAENTVTFPLSQGQKLMLGDTLEDDGVHHKRKQVVLNGTDEGIWEYSNGELYISNVNFSYDLPIPASEAKCSHFIDNNTGDINTFRIGNSWSLVFFTEFTNVNDWKTYLSQQYANGTPVTVEYELAIETTEPYTSTQQTAYNKLKEMQSYYDLTYVLGTSDNLQPILTAHAKKSLKVMQNEIDNINSRVTLLED